MQKQDTLQTVSSRAILYSPSLTAWAVNSTLYPASSLPVSPCSNIWCPGQVEVIFTSTSGLTLVSLLTFGNVSLD